MKSRPADARHVGTVAKLRKLTGTAYHPQIQARHCEFDQLVNTLARNYQLSDVEALRRAIDMAVRRYRDHGALSKKDASQLLEHIPMVANVLLSEGNDKRIADLLVRREDALIRGGKYDAVRHAQTVSKVYEIGRNLAELEQCLKMRPQRRGGLNVGLRSAIQILKRYWQDSGKRFAASFTPKDKKAGRRLAKSEAMKFVEAVVEFIDPAALSQLPSAVRPRPRGTANIDA